MKDLIAKLEGMEPGREQLPPTSLVYCAEGFVASEPSAIAAGFRRLTGGGPSGRARLKALSALQCQISPTLPVIGRTIPVMYPEQTGAARNT